MRGKVYHYLTVNKGLRPLGKSDIEVDWKRLIGVG